MMGCIRQNRALGMTSGVMLLLTMLPLSASAQVIPRQEVIRASEQGLRSITEQSEKKLRVEKVFFRDELRLPDGEVTWSVRTKPETLKPGRNTIPVEISIAGKVTKIIQVAVTLKQHVKYLTVRRTLKRGDTVAESDLQWEEAELAHVVPSLVQDPSQLIGHSAIRQIQAGKPLQSEWFGTPVVVARGDRVHVTVERGVLSIETVGVAQSAGRIGETIVLENPESRRRYDARILGPGRAQTLMW
ncbi:MAG: flagellar basal body P-ring formation chaperone FlgA [Magnetococcus sp. YQC-5]